MRHAGFSLMELLVCMTIISILFAISLPTVREFMSHSEDEVLQKEWLAAIEFAQQEAQARRSPIGLSQNKNGLQIFLDENKDGIHDQSQIISAVRLSSQHGEMHSRFWPHYQHYLSFLPTGFLNHENGSVWHCHGKKAEWAIILSQSGRTRSVMPNKNGELKDNHGKLLLCRPAACPRDPASFTERR